MTGTDKHFIHVACVKKCFKFIYSFFQPCLMCSKFSEQFKDFPSGFYVYVNWVYPDGMRIVHTESAFITEICDQ